MKIRRIADNSETKKKRVAAYARVSTESEEQQTSFDTQVGYYNNLIRRNPKWQYIGVYADEGSSGTNTDRPEFKRMISDALAGKIDIVLVKSISRFARNVVDASDMCTNFGLRTSRFASNARGYPPSTTRVIWCSICSPRWRTRNVFKEGRA